MNSAMCSVEYGKQVSTKLEYGKVSFLGFVIQISGTVTDRCHNVAQEAPCRVLSASKSLEQHYDPERTRR